MPVKLKQITLLGGDVFLLYGALFLALLVRYSEITGTLIGIHIWPFTIIFALWLMVFYIIGLYDLNELKNTGAFGKKFMLALTIDAAIAIAFFYFIPAFGIAPKTNLFIFLTFFGSAAYAWRTTINKIFLFGVASKRIVLIGSGEAASELENHLSKNQQLGYEVVSWIKNDQRGKGLARLREIMAEERTGIIVIENFIKRSPQASRPIYRDFGSDMEIMDVADLYETVFGKIPIKESENTDLVAQLAERHPLYDAVKLPLEKLLAILIGIIFLPIAAIIVLAIKMDSPGSAFFTQVRVGKGGKLFTLWKFRTMYKDAEKQGPRWAKPNDKRVTRLGGILRQTHLDELPQIWNIFRGELSLVGPRPERPEFIKSLRETIPFYDLRLLAIPGLTGWAQVNYRYGASAKDAYAKLEYDIYYIKHRSFWLDAAILIRTLKRIFVQAR